MEAESSPQTILIVDDQPINISILDELFHDEYQLLFATNGAEAITLTRDHQPDLILLDIVMPDMDGHEVCSILKADATTENIPIIFVTAMHEGSAESLGLELGAVDYITKPIHPISVKVRVKNQLELKQHRDQLETLVKQQTSELVQSRDQAREGERQAQIDEHLLVTILESSLDAFIMADHQGTILNVNPAAEQLFGYEQKSLVGRNLTETIIPPELRQKQNRAMRQASGLAREPASEKNTRNNSAQTMVNWSLRSQRITSEGLRRDGKRVDLEISLSKVSAHGQPIYSSFLRDITAKKQLRQALHSTLCVAEASFQEKDRFLATMSHEIRTPMHGVLGMIELALRTEPSAKICQFLQQAKASSHILLRVINDILDYSKMTADNMVLESTNFYLDTVLDHTVNLFQGVVLQKKLQLHCVASPPSVGELVGDPLRLQQILLNLVGNAIKFTQEGSVTITTRVVEETPVRVCLEFAIQDTGIGLLETQISQLFSPFVQADSSTTREFGGTGLGLTICKRLVEMMAGRIWVESTHHVGSTFYFSVILDRNSHSHPVIDKTVQTLDTHALAGRSVLLVDDNAINRLVASELLESINMQVSHASNGQEAVDAITKQPFDLVFMGILMPIMDGYQATQRIRTLEHGQEVPIIAMTATVIAGEREKCFTVGMNDCLIKPIDFEQIFAILLKWVTPLESPAMTV